MLNDAVQEQMARVISRLVEGPFEVVLVHGGGPFINIALEDAGIKSEFVEGQRYTTAEALTYIERTLKGQVNAMLVSAFNRAGLKAVGLSGKDGQTVVAKQRIFTDKDGKKRDIGQVGDVVKINPKLPETLLAAGFTPLYTCIASDEQHNDYNVNADMFAGHLAAGLKVHYYIVLTDVDGLYAKFPDPDSIIRTMSRTELEESFHTVIQGGMIPKMESCAVALDGGAEKAVVLNGTHPEQLAQLLLEAKPIGTTITP